MNEWDVTTTPVREVGGGVFIVGLVILMGVSILLGGGASIREQVWTEGYCAALGGERIARYTCDVDGQVVRV